MGGVAHSVKISLPESERLLDLYSISQDLRAVIEYIKIFVAMSANEEIDVILKRNLSYCVASTIFVRYARAVGNGVRQKTRKELISILNEDDLKTHELAVSIRDKHYAHSVNFFELPQFNVWLRTGEAERMVTSVSPAMNEVLAPDWFVFKNLLILVKKLDEWTVKEQKQESEKLLKIVKGRYTLDELYSLIGKSDPIERRYGDIAKKRSKH